MSNRTIPSVLITLLLTTGIPLFGQNRWSFGAEAGATHVLNVLDIHENLILNSNLANAGVVAACSTDPSKECLWAYGYNFPSLVLGFNITPHNVLKPRGGNLGLGNIYSAFIGADFSVFRSEWFSTGPFVRAGVAYASRIYDPVTNPGNQYIGTPVEGHFALGWNFSFYVAKQYELILSAGFSHWSCGKMFLPNWGVTNANVNVGIRYHMSEPYHGRKSSVGKPQGEYKKGLTWDIFVASGLHSCETIWMAEGCGERTVPCVRVLVGTDALWRYSPFFSSGLGVEFGWTSGVERLRDATAQLYPEHNDYISQFWVGLGAVQKFHYKNFSAHIKLGWYPYREVGNQEESLTGRFYQKLGMKYKFDKIPLFLGLDMRAHKFNSSDCIEFSVGVELCMKQKG